MPKKLHIDYDACSIPRTRRSKNQRKKHYSVMIWPNGKPCSLINFWLLDVSLRTSGETLRQYCVHMSHFVRYCYANNLMLPDFDSTHLGKLQESLLAETSSDGLRIRQNNHINAILNSVVGFLVWLQERGDPHTYHNLAGTEPGVYNVLLEPAKNSYGRSYFKHEFSLTKNTPQHHKTGMPQQFIDAIENQIYLEDEQTEKSRASPNGIQWRNYLYERRAFIQWAMLRTGMRPAELEALPLDLNLAPATTKVLYIPTRKLRNDSLNIRPFKLNLDGAFNIQHYLEARRKFCDHLSKSGLASPIPNSFLLTKEGGPLTSRSLSKDFSRLVKRAGLNQDRVCLSMYRHRFITQEVLVHIKEVFHGETISRRSLTNAVVRNIEERIRKKTGHKLGNSIWHYFDTAFDMLGVWGSVDNTLSNLQSLSDAEDQLKKLQRQVKSDRFSKLEISAEISRIEQLVKKIRNNLLF
ncbi:hypothetical protein PG5_01940 [Pseudomonas sp. G5(2012)]|nr:hypothetical protein PG5_01940 [Pseudomonas sp. G5(2012)]